MILQAMKTSTSFLRFSFSCIRYSWVALAALPQADGQSIMTKANNNIDLSSGTSWTGGVRPGALDTAYFGSTCTGAITSAIGWDMAIKTLSIAATGGDITINGTATKSLSVYSGGINMNSATKNLNLNGLSYVLIQGQDWSNAAGTTITADASTVISGTVGSKLTKTGSGTLTLNGHNTFLGQLDIRAGTVNLGHATDTLDDSITVYLGNALATLAIGANSDTVATVQLVSGASLTGGTGTLSATTSFLFAGNTVAAKLGGVAAVAIGGNSVLSAVNSYTGGTTIATAKTLTFSNGSLGTTGAITVNGELIWATGNTQDLSSRIAAAISGTKFNTNGNDVTFASALGGNTDATITKTGDGTLTLNGSNAYTGGTTISAGTLKIGHVNALGTTMNGAIISNGATLDVNGINTGDSISLTGTGVGANGALINSNTGTAASLSNTITLSGNASVGGAGDLTLNGQVSGAKVLTKVGAGTLTLGYANAYTATATISGGTLKLGASMPVSAITINSGTTLEINGYQPPSVFLSGTGINNKGALQNNGATVALMYGLITLTADASIGGSGNLNIDAPIEGAFALTKTGTGTMTISSDNQYGYSGGTTVSAGVLTAIGTWPLGPTTGPLTVSNPNSAAGTAVVLNLSTTAATTRGSLNGTIATPSSGTNTATINNGGKLFTVNQTTAGSYAGVLAGSGGFSLGTLSTNTLTLSGANTYSGGTTVSAGTLTGSGASPLGATTGALTVSNPNTGAGKAVVLNLSTTATTTTGSLSGTLSTPSSGTNTATINNGGRLFTVNQTVAGSYGGVLAGSGGFTLGSLSTNTLTLSGTHTYSGATAVSAGKLTIFTTGSINSTSAIAIGAGEFNYNSATALSKSVSFSGSGGTLSGSGTITPAVNVKAGNTLAPGNSIGTLSFGTGLTVAGTYAAQLGTPGATPAAGLSDRSVVAGNLTLTGSTLSLSDNAVANSQGAAATGAYRLMTYTGTLTGTFGTVTNPLGATLHESVVYGGGNVDLNLYRLATATAPVASAALGNARVGSPLTGSASVTSSASSDGFSELLKATVTGSGTGFTGVAGGGNGTLNYSLATSAAGIQSGSASVVLKSTGAGSYADTTLSTTSVALGGTAYDYANPTLNTTGPVAFGNVHVGAANPTANLSITNTAVSNASYQDKLNASASTGNLKVTGNSFTAQTAGTTGSLTLTAGAATVGSLASSVTLGYVSNANGVSGLSNSNLTNGSITTTGQVYSGQSSWSGGSGSWGTLTSGFGSNWGADQGSPGLDAGFIGVDSATLNGAGGTVALDAASPSLNALTLNGSGAYTLAQGSGGSLSLAGTAPAITSSGSNVISAPLVLTSATAVAVTGTLGLSGAISGSFALTKSAAGILTVSANNLYSGGTTVTAGSLLVSNTSGSGTGSGAVTVAGGATLGGYGTIAGNVEVSGTLAPGASIGLLTVDGDLSLTNGSTFAYEMDSSLDKTLAADLQLVGGTIGVAIGTNVALTLTDLAGGVFAADTTLSLLQYAGQWNGGFFTYGTNELANGEAFADTYGNQWTIVYDALGGGDNFATQLDDSHFITLSNISAVPEPANLLALSGLVSSALLLRSRRRTRVA
jgi:autotransporter-associated beta strand protein